MCFIISGVGFVLIYGLVGVDVCYNYAGVADISYSNIAPSTISE